MGRFARDVFLLEQFREVGPLKTEFFSGFGLVPSMSAQRLFEDLPAVGVHVRMVVTSGRSCLGFGRRGGQ